MIWVPVFLWVVTDCAAVIVRVFEEKYARNCKKYIVLRC